MNIWRFWLQGQINSIFTVARDTGFNAAELGQSRYTERRHWLQRVDTDDVDSSQGQFFSLANMAIEAALNGQGVAIGRATLVTGLLARGYLVAPFERQVKSPVKYWLLCSNELRQREELQVVMSWLREQAVSQQRHVG